jgi:hypothetical protein
MSTHPRPMGWLPIIIVYRRPWDRTELFLQAFGGGKARCEFTHCELFFPDSGETFTIFRGGNMMKSMSLPTLYKLKSEMFAWHLIPLNTYEYTRLLHWNRQQIAHHCPYNFRDLAWQIAPGMISHLCVTDLSVTTAHNPTRMFCSQAIVLALREASCTVGARQVLRNLIFSTNSRLVSPSDLSRLFTSYLGICVNCTEVPTDANEVNTHLHNAVFIQNNAFF